MRLHLSIILITVFGIHGLSAIAYGKDQEKRTHLEIAGTAALKSDVKDLKHTIITPHLKQAIPKDTNVLWCNTEREKRDRSDIGKIGGLKSLSVWPRSQTHFSAAVRVHCIMLIGAEK